MKNRTSQARHGVSKCDRAADWGSKMYQVMGMGGFVNSPMHPNMLGRFRTLANAEDHANQTMRNYVTSHSILGEPLVWIEDDRGIKVFEVWTELRVIQFPNGELWRETPIQFAGQAWVDYATPGVTGEKPAYMGHPMFQEPEKYGATLVRVDVNPLFYVHDGRPDSE